jgi:hypothetical protein
VKRTRVEILIMGLTVLALCAGVVAGLVAARLPVMAGPAPTPAPTPASPDRGPLDAALNLSADQREKMQQIWEGVRSKVNDAFDKAQDLQQSRDRDLVALLDDEKKAEFEKISQEYARRFIELGRQRDAAFDEAVERTKKLLNAEQRKKYEQILKTHVRPPAPPMGPITFSVPAASSPSASGADDGAAPHATTRPSAP